MPYGALLLSCPYPSCPLDYPGMGYGADIASMLGGSVSSLRYSIAPYPPPTPLARAQDGNGAAILKLSHSDHLLPVLSPEFPSSSANYHFAASSAQANMLQQNQGPSPVSTSSTSSSTVSALDHDPSISGHTLSGGAKTMPTLVSEVAAFQHGNACAAQLSLPLRKGSQTF